MSQRSDTRPVTALPIGVLPGMYRLFAADHVLGEVQDHLDRWLRDALPVRIPDASSCGVRDTSAYFGRLTLMSRRRWRAVCRATAMVFARNRDSSLESHEPAV